MPRAPGAVQEIDGASVEFPSRPPWTCYLLSAGREERPAEDRSVESVFVAMTVVAFVWWAGFFSFVGLRVYWAVSEA
jgi:hypothetical protein